MLHAYNPTAQRTKFVSYYASGNRRDRFVAKSVLAIGNCSYDHRNLAAAIQAQFDAEVRAAATADEALRHLTEASFDLVLVNRILEVDRSSGIDLVRQIKADPRLAGIPVMLVSNFSEAQAEAVAAGAEPGFGKKALNCPETVNRLQTHLG